MSNSQAYNDSLLELINELPLETIKYAFAYGSGAIEQQNEKISEKMVDFILVTSDSHLFHEQNLEKNSNHYSLLKFIGSKNLSVLQTNFCSHVYYNTMVKSKKLNRTFKYGVIGIEDLITDLLDWKWLYVAGRLHKPVLNLIGPSPSLNLNTNNLSSLILNKTETFVSPFQSFIYENRKSAVYAALLQLPDSFTHEQLFRQIIAHSYTGDFRLKFGEDRYKITKILHGAMEKMLEIYYPIINNDSRLLVKNGLIIQDNSSTGIYHRLNLLPWGVLNGLIKFYKQKDLRSHDIEEVVFKMAHRHDISNRVQEAIVEIVRPGVLKQTILNSLSAGLVKSLIYSSSKIFKMFKSIV